MNDFRAEPLALREAQVEAARRVIESGWYIIGPELQAFESAWARTCGLEHAVGVGNGMDAIEIGLRALGIGPGDEVITTPMTAFATVLAIHRAGAVPVLADIDPDTALLCVRSVERVMGRHTKAIVLVHLYGRMPDMRPWSALARSAQVHLVEDCAQAHLARSQGSVAGSFGSFGAYSFYPTKNLGALGDAGALVTRDADLAERVRCLRNYGQTQRYHHPHLGLNSRMDEMQAALLQVRLTWLQAFTERRRAIARAYRENMRNPKIRLLAGHDDEANVHHLFVITCDQRERFARFMAERGIQTLQHYPVPVHQQVPMLEVKRDPEGLSQAERHAATCLSLPCHPQMPDEQVLAVIEGVNTFE